MKSTWPRVGVIGAGQLAQLTLSPAIALGIEYVPFAQSNSDPAAIFAPHEIGDYTDVNQVLAFAKTCDVITFEHELTPISVIKEIEKNGIVVRPGSESFQFSQDKSLMRERLAKFPGPKWQIIEKIKPLNYPVIAKSISGGYDGRGVWKINSEQELLKILDNKLLIEDYIDFDFEIAVMVARSPHGQAATWAPTQTIQSEGICIETITPAPDMSPELTKQAQQLALDIAAEINLIGVMAVEMFVSGTNLYLNELALRPHNSGHWTIEGSVTSQFEQHLRAILDLPLGDTAMTSKYVVMGNILGGAKSNMYRPYLHLMARSPNLKFHHYRKEVKPGRKIGHVTITGENILELRNEVKHALAYLSGEIDE